MGAGVQRTRSSRTRTAPGEEWKPHRGSPVSASIAPKPPRFPKRHNYYQDSYSLTYGGRGRGMAWPEFSEGLSLVIATYNERENIEQLLAGIGLAAEQLRRPSEVVLVRDRSPDGTAELASQLGRDRGLDIRVVTPNGPRSLGGAIARGLDACRWDLVCVMDADLSHPPSLIPTLIASLDGADGVVASRYIPGADIESWPVRRHLISLVATLIARIGLRVRCRDPLSGFFVFRRSFLRSVRIRGDGNKPLLEILVQAQPMVAEIPYLFRNRKNGESKLTCRSIGEFLS